MNGKLCRRCKQDTPDVYGGKRPRHVCQKCQAENTAENDRRRRGANVDEVVRALVYAEANGKCAACGVHTRFRKADRYDAGDDLANVDHIVPVLHGGTGHRANLQLLCKGCNRRKGTKLPQGAKQP